MQPQSTRDGGGSNGVEVANILAQQLSAGQHFRLPAVVSAQLPSVLLARPSVLTTPASPDGFKSDQSSPPPDSSVGGLARRTPCVGASNPPEADSAGGSDSGIEYEAPASSAFALHVLSAATSATSTAPQNVVALIGDVCELSPSVSIDLSASHSIEDGFLRDLEAEIDDDAPGGAESEAVHSDAGEDTFVPLCKQLQMLLLKPTAAESALTPHGSRGYDVTSEPRPHRVLWSLRAADVDADRRPATASPFAPSPCQLLRRTWHSRLAADCVALRRRFAWSHRRNSIDSVLASVVEDGEDGLEPQSPEDSLHCKVAGWSAPANVISSRLETPLARKSVLQPESLADGRPVSPDPTGGPLEDCTSPSCAPASAGPDDDGGHGDGAREEPPNASFGASAAPGQRRPPQAWLLDPPGYALGGDDGLHVPGAALGAGGQRSPLCYGTHGRTVGLTVDCVNAAVVSALRSARPEPARGRVKLGQRFSRRALAADCDAAVSRP